MKKIVLTVVAMMAIANATFAENNNSNATENTEKEQYTFDYSNDAVARYLHLDEDQKEDAKSIHWNFCRDMNRAYKASDEKRQKYTKRAIYRNLACMRYILNEEQFKNYRKILQATMVNRGIEY